MTKAKASYQCENCGVLSPKWVGQCPECADWNTLVKVMNAVEPTQLFSGESAKTAQICPLSEVTVVDVPRYPIGLPEFDRALGGGLVHGSVTLLGGDPGIGKSTLLLQALAALAQSELLSVYISAEESQMQIAMRAERLGLPLDTLFILTENHLEVILSQISARLPKVLVIDSIQTVYTDQIPSPPGAVAQVKACTAQLVRLAKRAGIAIFLVGHVTKEGNLAGPRILEHMVDTVLYFEGDSSSRYRMIRAVKNRYGAVNELGIFAMTERGLRGVSNPSAIFLSRHTDQVSGSVVMVTREGTRPLLVEVQALVSQTQSDHARRITLGLEQNRLIMLLAVMYRHMGMSVAQHDVFVNVVGGVRLNETGGDLAILLAVLSSLRDQKLPNDLVVFGELGLSGEIRPVQGGEERLKDAAKHGFRRAIIPIANRPTKQIVGLSIHAIAHLSELSAVVELTD